ncbi:MAG TPA: hypothetical protein VHE54_16475 [Puia sp.]|nr:hypothetical protein [Puia sp.]
MYIRVCAETVDSTRYTLRYRSPEQGMPNRWDLWVRADRHVAVKQAFLVQPYIKGRYHKLRRRTRKAREAFQNVLGDVVYDRIKRSLPALREPVYAKGFDYQRAGAPIVLGPDSGYFRLFPDLPGRLFEYHAFEPYFWLSARYYP